MSEPNPTGRGSAEISEAAERARRQLREDFEQLRAEIEEERAAESGAVATAAAGRHRGKAKLSFAAFAVTAAVAAAAANFALNGGRGSRESDVSVPPASSKPEPGAIAAPGGKPQAAAPLLATVPEGLRIGGLGSNEHLPSAASPFPGPSPLFVVGTLFPVGGHGATGERVAGAAPVGRSPGRHGSPAVPGPPTQPLPSPEAPKELAYAPPPPNGGHSHGGGNPGEPGGGGGSPGEGPGGGPPPTGGGKPEGPLPRGVGNGHIKARGKGHGGSNGKGHEKDAGGGESTQPAPSGGGPPERSGGSSGGKGGSPPGRGREKSHGPPPAPAPAPTSPPPAAPAPEPAPAATPAEGETPGKGHGKSGAPGQLKK